MAETPRPRRVVVAHPRTLAARGGPGTPDPARGAEDDADAAGPAQLHGQLDGQLHPQGHPRGHAQGHGQGRPQAHTHGHGQGRLGDVYLRSLMRTQLRLGLAVVGVLVVLLGGLPLLFARVPALREATVGGVPLPWIIIAAGLQPILISLGSVLARRADANERDFTEMAERSW